MAIIGSVFGLLGRFAGRLLNSALGWATLLLFGRVPQSKQYILLAITFGSLIWVVALVGLLFPDVGAFLLAAVPAPKFIDRTWIRIAMLIAAIVLPLFVGVGSLALMTGSRRPKGRGLVTGVLRGYPFALVLAVSLVFLAVIGSVRKARSLAKRWEDNHVPMVVRPGCYDDVVAALRDALDDEHLDLEPHLAPRVMELPAHLLAAVAGGGVRDLVPDRLKELKGRECEIFVYPSDIAISGSKERLARARAAIAARLTSAPAFMTTSAESQAVEEQIEGVMREVRESGGKPGFRISNVRQELATVDDRLRTLTVPNDEWETLYRMRLQAERDAIGSEMPRLERAATRRNAAPALRREPGPLSPALQWAASIAGLSLTAIDLVMAILDRTSPPPRRRDPRLPWS